MIQRIALEGNIPKAAERFITALFFICLYAGRFVLSCGFHGNHRQLNFHRGFLIPVFCGIIFHNNEKFWGDAIFGKDNIMPEWLPFF